MNMILHDFSTANIASGGEGTLVKLRFLNGKQLRTFDYVVANPPFSDKTWSRLALVLPSEDSSVRARRRCRPRRPMRERAFLTFSTCSAMLGRPPDVAVPADAVRLRLRAADADRALCRKTTY